MLPTGAFTHIEYWIFLGVSWYPGTRNEWNTDSLLNGRTPSLSSTLRWRARRRHKKQPYPTHCDDYQERIIRSICNRRNRHKRYENRNRISLFFTTISRQRKTVGLVRGFHMPWTVRISLSRSVMGHWYATKQRSPNLLDVIPSMKTMDERSIDCSTLNSQVLHYLISDVETVITDNIVGMWICWSLLIGLTAHYHWHILSAVTLHLSIMWQYRGLRLLGGLLNAPKAFVYVISNVFQLRKGIYFLSSRKTPSL